MKFLKNTLVSLLVLSTLATAGTFEQNGVKAGNDRISLGLTSLIHNDSGADASGTIYAQYGRFITDDIEVGAYIYTGISGSDIDYQIAPGVNYYFLKTPTLTPYAGVQYYYTDSTRDGDWDSNGGNLHIGAHKFLNENFSISPEAGARFVDFTDYTSTYLNIYLTYFFN